MNSQTKIYYVPQNPHIKSSKTYTFYLNNNTNLDLSSILNLQTLQLKDLIQKNISSNQQNSIIITDEEYQKLIELNEKVSTLIEERNKNIQEFIHKEAETTTELTKINTERQGLIKTLTKMGDKNAR